MVVCVNKEIFQNIRKEFGNLLRFNENASVCRHGTVIFSR